MAKALKTAAIVVGAIALVATGVGAAIGAAAAASTTIAGVSIATIATVASVAAGVLSIAANLMAKKPTAEATGSQTSFSADPDAGIPYALGRTGTAGNIVMRKGFNTSDAGDNDRQAFVAILSLGPVKSVGGFTSDRSPVSFNSVGQALGTFAGFMWMTTQLGALPEASAMGFGSGAGTPPGWTASHKLSGLAAAAWTLRFDTKAKLYQNGVPAPMWVVEGGLCYDPRKDSTYPGGSGSHRMADPGDTAAYDAAVATWEYSEDPYLHALKWAHGVWQRDKMVSGSKYQRVMGMGAPWEGIDVPAFVEGANIAQANGWKVGGVIFSGDDKWDSMKKILQAGMGEPLALGAKISCLVNAPKVSLATITTDDVVGEATVAATQPRRDRINTVTPRYRLEANNWQLLPGPPISVAEYVAADRGKRSKVLDYAFIQDSKQVATAVRYDIENAREFGPIVLPLKLFWMGYKPGDCVTAELPELGLNGQTILLLNRELDPSSGIATMTARSETPGKHPFALGQTTTPPATPALSGPPLVPVPGASAWDISATGLTSGGVSVPALVVTGDVDAGSAEAVVFEYRPFISGQAADVNWRAAGTEPVTCERKEIASVTPATAYEVAVSYRVRGVIGSRRILGPETTVAGYAAIIEGSATGAGGWHRPPEEGDQYLRISNDGGLSFGEPFKIVGEDGGAGINGQYPQTVFRFSATQPATPSGNGIPSGWSDGIPAGSGPLWMTVATQRDGVLIPGASWSVPFRISAPTVLGQWSVSASGPWHSDFTAGDLYMRQSFDGGASWQTPARAVGEDGTDGTDGVDGQHPSLIFKRSATQPSAPGTGTGNPPSGWSDAPPTDSTLALWFSTADFRNSTQLSNWSTPVRLDAPPLVVQWSVNGSTGWHSPYAVGDLYQRQSTDNGVTWGPAMRAIGEDGTDGTDGVNGEHPSLIFKRSSSAPAAPGTGTGNPPSGWSDGPPAGDDPLYQSTATFRDGAQLSAWSTPVRIDGENGNWKDTKFLRSLAQPATPTGDNPAGWTDGIPAGTETIWQIIGEKTFAGNLTGGWSNPQAITSAANRGAYSGTETYYLGNIVTYNGGSYSAVQDNFSGHAPSGTAQVNSYWDVVAAPGEPGTPATPPSGFTATINIGSTDGTVNLRSLADANGYTGASDATITFVVTSGATVQALGGSASSGGGTAIDTGTWPAGYTIALTFQNNGTIQAGGGGGGMGGGGGGGGGGVAIYCRVNLTGGITNNGTIRGGGGGGGSQAWSGSSFKIGPHGGGGGAPNGEGGTGQEGSISTGHDGQPGQPTGGGAAGGTGAGAGGGFATAGASGSGGPGGPAGYAISKNGFTVAVTGSGTITGTVA